MDRDEVALGSSSYFIGRISQLLLYDHQMSAVEVEQAYNLQIPDTPRPSVLDQEQTTMLLYSVDYRTHLRDLQCLENGLCDIFDGKIFNTQLAYYPGYPIITYLFCYKTAFPYP